MNRIVMRVRMHFFFTIPWFVYHKNLILNKDICRGRYTVAEFVQPAILLFKLHLFHFLEHFCSLLFSISPTLLLILFVGCKVLLVWSRDVVVFTSVGLASLVQSYTCFDFHHFMRLRIECLHHLAMIIVFEISPSSQVFRVHLT